MPEDDVSGAAADSIELTAGRWILRREEGLSPAEESELAAWAAADPRHARALAERARAWARFEPLAEEAGGCAASGTAILARPGKKRPTPRILRFAVPALAAAAVVALVFLVRSGSGFFPRATLAEKPAVVLPGPCERLALPDGSEVELNRGARARVAFTPTERRVHLELGEANFSVAADPSRPFVVETAGGVEVRALGTVFNVRLGAAAEVLVTEGAVRVAPPHQAPVAIATKQRIVVGKDTAAPPRLETLSDAEIAMYLAWQPQMLDFDDVPLSSVVSAFNRHNPIRLVVADPEVAAVRMNGTFRSDNVAGFVRLLERNYAIRVERGEGDGVVRLYK